MPILPKISTFRDLFVEICLFIKSCFLPICLKCQHFEEKWLYLQITLKNCFLPILPKISTFWDLSVEICLLRSVFLLKIVFWYLSKMSTFQRKSTLFEDYLKKNCFLPIFPKISTFWDLSVEICLFIKNCFLLFV